MAVTPIPVSPSLASVLNAAGDRSNVDFDYLLQTAQRESRLNPVAKAPTSSATGLFQFLDTTWLQVMKTEGGRLGYQRYADAITQDRDGDYVIRDNKLRAEVLKLREDPSIAADMAAAFTRNNGAYLKGKFGRMPSPGELYIAHFLGAQGAEKLFAAGLKNPDQVAATLFPRAAAANRTIFYDGGQPRTIRQVYRALVAQHGGPEALHPGFAVQQMMAQQPGAAAPVPLAPLPPRGGRAAQPVDVPRPGHFFVLQRPQAAVPPVAEGNSRPVVVNAADAPVLPSRIGQADMNFAAMFTTEPGAAAQSPLQPLEDGQGAFFSQLYGQK